MILNMKSTRRGPDAWGVRTFGGASRVCRRSSSTTPGLQWLETTKLRGKRYVSFCHSSNSTTPDWPHACPSPHHVITVIITGNSPVLQYRNHCHSHYSQLNHNQDEDRTWRRSTVAYKRGSFVMSRKPVLHCEMATKEGTSKRARTAKMISLF